MTSNQQGNIGEGIALSYFLSEGYEVYLPFGTAGKCDMIIMKDNITKRVSVKTCSSEPRNGSYRVKIRQGKLNKEIPFNKETSDILFVYLVGPKRIHIFETQDVTNKFELYIRS
jgi:hypothetical protein